MKNLICFIVLCISAASMSEAKKVELKVVECTYEYEVMKCNE